MRILFNCSVNRVGGTIQNAANFILQARADEHNVFVFIVSHPVYELLVLWGAIDDRVILVNHPLFSRKIRKYVLGIERKFKPDVVYTMAGPTYLKFKCVHVLGVSDGYITHAGFDSFFYAWPFLSGVKQLLKSFIKGFAARLEGNFFIFQTQTSRLGFCRRLFLDVSKSEVVPNAIGNSFLRTRAPKRLSELGSKDELVILCPSADYPHKDLRIIERLANAVANSSSGPTSLKLKFIVTVDADSGSNSGFYKRVPLINNISDNVAVVNYGAYSYSEAVKLYQSCDIVFMPSLLETFSTSYLEALAAGKFLVVADKKFSREICGNAAVYFEPKNEYSALDAFVSIWKLNIAIDEAEYDGVLSKYGNYDKRYSALISAIKAFL